MSASLALYERLLRPALFRLDAEAAHHLAISALAHRLVPTPSVPDDPRLARNLFGLAFPNPLGLAGGLDKDARAADGLLSLGFGFVEAGTVTPRPQPGNPRPRLFRLAADDALINRFGFNSEGASAAHERLAARFGKPGLVGVNLGANKESTDRAADYVAGVKSFADVAAFFTVNISSPNTAGLRDLQAKAALAELIARVLEARNAQSRLVPVLVKIAPDLDAAGLADIAELALASGIDGLILGNTTLERSGLSDPQKSETGGLSGRPLFRRSTILLARLRKLVGPRLPLIGVGGIFDGADAFAKFEAGADLVQLYTGLIYRGPGLPAAILTDLIARLDRDGAGSIADVVGRRTKEWAAETV